MRAGVGNNFTKKSQSLAVEPLEYNILGFGSRLREAVFIRRCWNPHTPVLRVCKRLQGTGYGCGEGAWGADASVDEHMPLAAQLEPPGI